MSTLRVNSIQPLTGTTVTISGSLNVATASYANTAATAVSSTSASFALTASYAANGGGGGGGVSYTSYTAVISGDSPVTSSVFENTTGLTFTWASGSNNGDGNYSYTTTISSVTPAKLAIFTTGQVNLYDNKGINVIYPKPSYKITTVNPTTATIDIWYDSGAAFTPGNSIITEVRIYP